MIEAAAGLNRQSGRSQWNRLLPKAANRRDSIRKSLHCRSSSCGIRWLRRSMFQPVNRRRGFSSCTVAFGHCSKIDKYKYGAFCDRGHKRIGFRVAGGLAEAPRRYLGIGRPLGARSSVGRATHF